jgi:hypothetical protein
MWIIPLQVEVQIVFVHIVKGLVRKDTSFMPGSPLDPELLLLLLLLLLLFFFFFLDYKWKECTFLIAKFEVFIVGIIAGKLLFWGLGLMSNSSKEVLGQQ